MLSFRYFFYGVPFACGEPPCRLDFEDPDLFNRFFSLLILETSGFRPELVFVTVVVILASLLNLSLVEFLPLLKYVLTNLFVSVVDVLLIDALVFLGESFSLSIEDSSSFYMLEICERFGVNSCSDFIRGLVCLASSTW